MNRPMFAFLDADDTCLANGFCEIRNGVVISGQADVVFAERTPFEDRTVTRLWVYTIDKKYSLSVGTNERPRWWHKFTGRKPITYDVNISNTSVRNGDTITIDNVDLEAPRK